jgi:deoxyguanosine kinase
MWLGVEGIIGAGKTTSAEILGERSTAALLIERSDQHPLLGSYYSDPARYAFETELIFMALQAQQVAGSDDSNGFISDFTPAKNFVFARFTCSPADLALLEAIDERLWGNLPKPDLVVVLDVPPQVCLRRIAKRGYGYEENITVSDLERLRVGYMKALSELGAEVQVLSLSGDETPNEVANQVADLAQLA